MGKSPPRAPGLLKSWRARNGYTVREAGGLIVVEGKPVDGATWHAWEKGRKIPKAPWLLELERVVGVQPNDFYSRPDAGEIASTPQLALF